MIFHCERCEAVFDHPDVEECEHVEGGCALLMGAGWKPVWVKVYLAVPSRDHVFSRGGWLCLVCAA